MDFGKIEEELVEQRSTVEKVVDEGGKTLEGRVGHASEIDKGEQEVASLLNKQAGKEQTK